MRIAALLTSACLIVLPTAAQEPAKPAAFELASIKPTIFPNEAYFNGFAVGAGMCGMWRFTPVGDRVSLRAVTLCSLIRMAFDVKDYQVVPPAWVLKKDASLFYEIEARAAEGTTLTLEQARAMLQLLLADRFKLKFHREPRVAPVYALVVGKQGHKLSGQELPCAKPGAGISFSTAGSISSCRPVMSMTQLTLALSRDLDRVVVDRTNLTGQYAFVLEWAGRDPLSGTDTRPSLFTAIQEQLGLRLEASTEPVDALVIDHIEAPSPN